MADALRLHVRPRLRRPLLVVAFEGWNDAGEAASSAARFLREAFAPAPLAEIDGEEFFDFTVQRPRIGLETAGIRRIDWPRVDFSYGSVEDERELVVALGPEPHLRWRRFSDLVLRLVAEMEIREVVLLGAYLADVLYSRPVAISGWGGDPAGLEALGVRPSGYEGPTGILGVLGERLRREGLAATGLWAALPHYITASPNPRGTLALLQMLGQTHGLHPDLAPLRAEAGRFEERISALVAADPDISEYVRELKRREFAS